MIATAVANEAQVTQKLSGQVNGELSTVAAARAANGESVPFSGGGGAWLGAYFEGPGNPRQFIDPNRQTPR